jgi:uncharacterized membrane protein YgdD (TMEM256/DUF423 family)
LNKLVTASIIGMFSVMVGAFGEHYLDVNNLAIIKRFHTGLRYHQLYSIVLLFLAFIERLTFEKNNFLNNIIKKSFIFFLVGVLLFVGSIYINVFFNIKFFVYLTPFGGLTLILSWFYLAVKSWNQANQVPANF